MEYPMRENKFLLLKFFFPFFFLNPVGLGTDDIFFILVSTHIL